MLLWLSRKDWRFISQEGISGAIVDMNITWNWKSAKSEILKSRIGLGVSILKNFLFSLSSIIIFKFNNNLSRPIRPKNEFQSVIPFEILTHYIIVISHFLLDLSFIFLILILHS